MRGQHVPPLASSSPSRAPAWGTTSRGRGPADPPPGRPGGQARWEATPTPLELTHPRPVQAVHLAATTLVAVDNVQAHLWRVDQGLRLPGPAPHGRRIVASATDGAFVATAADDGSLRLFGPDSDHLHALADLPLYLQAAGGQVAVSGRSGTCLLDATTGRITWATAASPARGVAPALDAAGLAVIAGDRISLWSGASGVERTLVGPRSPITAVALDRQRVAAGTLDGQLWLWRRDSGDLLRGPRGAGDAPILRLRLTGRRLVVGRDDGWRVFGVESGRLRAQVASCGMAADGVPVGHLWGHIGLSGQLRLDALTKASGRVALPKAPAHARAIASSGHRLAVGGSDGALGKVTVWRLRRTAG